MSAIDDLKNVKIPLWARFLGYWRARRRRKAARKEFAHVATVTHFARRSNTMVHSWYVLKERGDGKRVWEFRRGHNSWVDPEHTWVFVHIIEPWALGRWSNKTVAEWAANQKEPEFR